MGKHLVPDSGGSEMITNRETFGTYEFFMALVERARLMSARDEYHFFLRRSPFVDDHSDEAKFVSNFMIDLSLIEKGWDKKLSEKEIYDSQGDNINNAVFLTILFSLFIMFPILGFIRNYVIMIPDFITLFCFIIPAIPCFWYFFIQPTKYDKTLAIRDQEVNQLISDYIRKSQKLLTGEERPLLEGEVQPSLERC